jgi:hypothetical protein
MILRVAGVMLALVAAPIGVGMIVRRLRAVRRGGVHGTIVSAVAARAGGAMVYHLGVETEDPEIGTRAVRAYREFEIDSRVRIWVHPSDGTAWLAEWSHLGYELMIGLFVAAAGVLAAAAVLIL